jgi:hypothetical protein
MAAMQEGSGAMKVALALPIIAGDAFEAVELDLEWSFFARECAERVEAALRAPAPCPVLPGVAEVELETSEIDVEYSFYV